MDSPGVPTLMVQPANATAEATATAVRAAIRAFLVVIIVRENIVVPLCKEKEKFRVVFRAQARQLSTELHT
jgi:hypothetical protein